MTSFNKIKWVLGILIVFVLIVATNLIDRNNFQRVETAVIAIYEDRLITKSLIFEISKAVQEKELAVVKADSVFFLNQNGQVSNNIQLQVEQFRKTKLTAKEKNVFSEFQNSLEKLEKAETVFIQSQFLQKEPLIKQISLVKGNLDALSVIQLEEGKRQLSITQKAMDKVELFTQLEIYMLIAMAILVQILILYTPKKEQEEDLMS